ncbi:MAG: DUF58 domain-containing protein [Clostridiales bacterium]|nr:DUF58 domain-containing protein [Clostridiales bacterium]
MLQNKIRYLAILIITGGLAILYNEYFMGILFLSVLIFPFILFAILSYIYGRVSFELISTTHISNRQETIPISIQIHNPTIFPIPNIGITIKYFNSFSRDKKAHKQIFNVSVDKHIKTTVTCNLTSQHTGNLEIMLSKVRIYDFFKIFSLRKKKLGQIKVAVLPYYYELTEDFLENRSRMQIESDYYSTIKAGDDPSEVFAIREYREGDRPQRIHWKLSIKQDQLMIKEFSDPLNCSVVIFADLTIPKDEDELDATDSLLECALSLSYSFMIKGQIHYLTWYDQTQGCAKRVRIVTEKEFFEAVDRILQCGPHEEGIDLMANYLAEYPNDQYTEILYITKSITSQQLDSLILIKSIDRQILYVSKAEYADTEIMPHMSPALPLATDLVKKISETGMGLFSINSSNIKSDLKGLKLG